MVDVRESSPLGRTRGSVLVSHGFDIIPVDVTGGTGSKKRSFVG